MSDVRAAGKAPVIWKGQALVVAAPNVALVRLTADAFAPQADVTSVFTDGGRTIAAHILEAGDEAAALGAVGAAAPDAIFADVMIELGRYAPRHRYELVRALAIERWSNRSRFCSACGFPLVWTSEAMAQICTNPQRVHRHFPRLDPAVIVLVTDGSRVLLGRAARWPAGTYSTLAGFVEPGETLEATIAREVFEEAGILVGAVRYFGSEAWPFPRSLMLGFTAEARSVEISLNDAELEDARWFDARELTELQARMKTGRPFFDTIARRMIDAWLANRD